MTQNGETKISMKYYLIQTTQKLDKINKQHNEKGSRPKLEP